MIRPVRPDGTIETGGVFVPVVRRRVLERLASAAMQRIVLVIAPAGYGKSVALRQFLDSIPEPCVRYDVLPDNGGLLGFLRGFADALIEIAPDARATLAGAYERNAGSDQPGADLAMWMHAHLKGHRGIIAIDDLHVAQDDREVTRFLASLIERTKGRVQWIIASRTALGLPIGTWLAYGESDLAIDEHDLKFSFEEARDAAKTFRLGVRDEELYELLNLTDGWATAMSFALRSSTRSVDLRNISTMTREMIYRYLAEQVYSGLNEAERELIETAALLPEIHVELLVAAGFERAVVAIEELRQRVAFIQETDKGGIYRLHDLFRDFVLHQLRKRGEDVLQARAIRIGVVMENSGQLPAALRLYAEYGATEQLRRLLESDGVGLIGRGHADDVHLAVTSAIWQFQNVPVVKALRGLIDITRGEFRSGQAAVYEALHAGLPKRCRTEVTLQLAVAETMHSGRPEPLLLEIADDPEVADADRIEAQALLAVCHTRVGNLNAAKAVMTEVIARRHELVRRDAQARLEFRAGTVYMALGDARRAREALDKAVEIGKENALWSVVAKAFFNLSLLVLYADADVAMSLWYAQQAAAAATRAGEYVELQGALFMMLSLETRRGNGERAAQIEKQIGELRFNDAQRMNYIASSQAHRHAWAGRYAEAHRLFGAIVDRQIHVSDRMLNRAAYALCLALDGMSKQSSAVVEKTLDLFPAAQETSAAEALFANVANVLLVFAEIASGRLTSAQRILKRIPENLHPVAQAFKGVADELLRAAKNPVFSLEQLESMLATLREQGFGGYVAYVSHVVSSIERQRDHVAVVTLTPSEARIVRELASGLSPKEIAAEMGRSVYTVQTHIQNLTEKLGCHGRAEAIAVARRLGYLEGLQ